MLYHSHDEYCDNLRSGKNVVDLEAFKKYYFWALQFLTSALDY